ncbi:protein arginine N-methyltransferase 5 isoform X2 [Drosophila serrata]|uniref:protein arginine N-methyltransferase 5 isoform X2 n=1 Tax=Drosophila serrata TaxID=7274 RepID=UPI000A1D364C|nr:protein arginine N-methyltransferase 5 isoform X2 [Drosophila serrata]
MTTACSFVVFPKQNVLVSLSPVTAFLDTFKEAEQIFKMVNYVCLLQEGISNIPKFVEKATHNKYAVVATSINANMLPFEPHESDPTYPATVLSAAEWNSKVIFTLSDVNVDSPNAKLRAHAKEVLLREVTWAEHLQNSGNVMMRLRSPQNENLAAIVRAKTKGNWLIRVPITNPELDTFEHRKDATEEDIAKAETIDPWSWWNKLRFAVDHNPKVKVVIELNDSDRPCKETVRRWLGEPIEAIIIPSSLFVRNRSNYAVLKKEWQVIIGHFITVRANIIISTNPNDNALNQYADYLNKLISLKTDIHEINSYEHVLEIPLQPLSDNLDTYTYEIFETDPVKYKLYQNAVQAALLDRVSDNEAKNKLTVIMLLGGGRGPLARAVFNAAELAQRQVRLYIIEKNPNAIRTLSYMVKTLWANKDVHIFSKDMREFDPPELADIMVSELLGSFGDNELSPECLDGALKLLKPDGISIPYKSTSYINPLMSSILYQNICALPSPTAFDCGYVVLMKNIYHIDEPQALFEFTHPNRDEKIDNTRCKVLKFTAKKNCVMHGIGGYFDTHLYKDICLSINPLTHTPGMFSWFPMFFPTRARTLKEGQSISIKYWRCVDATKVWYEWQVVNSPEDWEHQNICGIGYNMRLWPE